MKKYLLIIVLFLAFQHVKAQLSIGPKIGLGVATLSSGNLKDNLYAQKQRDSNITAWDVKNRPGLSLGFGAFAQYDLNDKLSLLTELTYNSFNAKIKIYREEDKLDNGGSGDVSIIDSEAKIKTSLLSIPVLVKYNFTGSLHALAGFRMNFVGTTTISSEEVRTKKVYANNTLIKDSGPEWHNVSATVDAFNKNSFNFVLGIGTGLDLNGKKLALDLRYYLPLTKSAMYTSSIQFDDIATKNNEVFGYEGKRDAEENAPGYLLNDFKMGILEVSASYPLFQK
jgi:hypothetical protein